MVNSSSECNELFKFFITLYAGKEHSILVGGILAIFLLIVSKIFIFPTRNIDIQVTKLLAISIIYFIVIAILFLKYVHLLILSDFFYTLMLRDKEFFDRVLKLCKQNRICDNFSEKRQPEPEVVKCLRTSLKHIVNDVNSQLLECCFIHRIQDYLREIGRPTIMHLTSYGVKYIFITGLFELLPATIALVISLISSTTAVVAGYFVARVIILGVALRIFLWYTGCSLRELGEFHCIWASKKPQLVIQSLIETWVSLLSIILSIAMLLVLQFSN